MAEAAKLNADRGARIIDINKKVVNGQAGSALMRDEAHAARIDRQRSNDPRDSPIEYPVESNR
jgi:tRNA-dihydrouridine synthase